MKDFDLFERADDKTADRLSEKVTLSGEQKDRIFAASMEKYEKMKSAGTADIEEITHDSETERREEIKVRRLAPIISAAACFIAVVGISGAFIALRGSDKNSTDSHTSSIVTSSKAPVADESSSSRNSKDSSSVFISESKSESRADGNTSEGTDTVSESEKETDTSRDETQIITEITTYEDDNDNNDNEQNNDDDKTDDNKQQDNKQDDKQDDNKKDDHGMGDLPDEFIDEIQAASKELIEDLKAIDLISVSVIDTDKTVIYDKDFNETSHYAEDDAYVRVTDSRFSSTDDIKAYISSKMSGYALSYYLKQIDKVYKDHDGKLYTYYDYCGESIYAGASGNEMSYYNITKTSFSFEAPFNARGGSICGKVCASCVLDNGTWKIDRVKDVYDDAVV